MQMKQCQRHDQKIFKSVISARVALIRLSVLSICGASLIACTKVKFDEAPKEEKAMPSLVTEAFQAPEVITEPVPVAAPAPEPVVPPEKNSTVVKCPMITTVVNGNGCSVGSAIVGGGGDINGSRNVQASASCTQTYQNGVMETTTSATTQSDDPNSQAYSYAVMIDDGKVTNISESSTNLKEGSALKADYDQWIQSLTQMERSQVDLKNCAEISVPSGADFSATKDYFLFSEVNLGKITATSDAKVRVIRSQLSELSVSGTATGCADNQSKIQVISGSVSRCR